MMTLVINESHTLFEEQKALILEELGDEYDTFQVPKDGMDLDEIKKLAKDISDDMVIIASPIPALLKYLSV